MLKGKVYTIMAPKRSSHVSRLKGQGNRKQACPTAKFVMSKSYWVVPPVGSVPPQASSLAEINVSTPFQPINVKSGLWTANDSNSEPHGLDSDIYAQYQHLVVKGCHISVNVMDSPDNVGSGTNTLVEGTVSLTRTTDTNVVTSTTLNSAIRGYYGSKMKDFTMGDIGQLSKQCRISAGYSPKKQWHSSAQTNQDLYVVNTSGSSNTPADSTYICLDIRPSDDATSSLSLKPFKVQIRLSYIIMFLEPTAVKNIPLPLGRSYTRYPRGRQAELPDPSWKAVSAALGALTAYNKYQRIQRRRGRRN